MIVFLEHAAETLHVTIQRARQLDIGGKFREPGGMWMLRKAEFDTWLGYETTVSPRNMDRRHFLGRAMR